jgi:hypothetical protein
LAKSSFGGLRILVSPFMMFDVASKTTDIIMFNSRNLGALIVDEKPHVKSWDEPQYSIHNLGIEESYGFGVLNEGQAIAVAKNVKVRQNEMSTPARPVISIGADNTNFQSQSGLIGVAPFDVNDDNYSVNRHLHVDAELRSAAGDSRPGCCFIHCWLGF